MERPQGNRPYVYDRCDRCLSDSSPAIVTTGTCLHKFCVKCILSLWSSRKVREPIKCPIDGVELSWLCPARIPFPEEIGSVIGVYNRLFGPNIPRDLAHRKFSRNMTLLYTLEGVVCLAGLLAHFIKVQY